MMLFLKFQGQTRAISEYQLRNLIELCQKEDERFYFQTNGRSCMSDSLLTQNQTVSVYCTLVGGKGGFGAKLKTQGGKKVRPNENMFSRDLQGRPISYSHVSREYQEFYKKKLLQEQKVIKQIADYKIVASANKEEFSSTKLDHSYNARMQQNQKRVKEAMKSGIKKYLQKKNQQLKTTTTGNRKQEQNQKIQEQKIEKNDEQQLQPVKRSQPIGKRFEQQNVVHQAPQKRLKQNQDQAEHKVGLQTKMHTAAPQKLLSAKEKLKSLFKK